MLFSWPRSHLLEIGDQTWCPSWLHRYEQLILTQLWDLKVPGWSQGSLATQACAVFREHLEDLSSYTVVDICAGAGGPTPVLETKLNKQLESAGKDPMQFILTDIDPHVEAWERITKKHQNVMYIESPVDARAVPRFAGKSKECRIFNICFHHFKDEDAAGLLRSAIESADSFMIFEFTSRDLWTCFTMPLVVVAAFVVTLGYYWSSPLHLFYTFILPVAPLTLCFDGIVSCLRSRTAEKTWRLLDQSDLDLTTWTFSSGQKTVLFPFVKLYYHVGVKS